ncbi:winged helix DNA-binding domain-containing protein [Actinocorallia longicatena]|uniref:winged helix DNA-binding domain-containing protein n=1 Tax=Actinocorallia longicatena TaxID=111803 RepID=UPI0031D724C9
MTDFSLARVRGLVLSRQGLTGPRLGSVGEATSAAVGVFGSAPTCYLSYAARVAGFRLEDLDRELYGKRSLVRVRSMHEMAFVLPVEDLPVILSATNAGDGRAEARILKAMGIDGPLYEHWSARVLEVLAGVPTASVTELRGHLGADAPKYLNYVVALMGRQCRVVRAEVRGGWRSDSYSYAAWPSWTGAALAACDPAEARAELARRYLWSFGPATAADLKWWAGWTVRDTRAALAALDVTEITVADVPALVLTEDLDALAAAAPPKGVRLLPYWDALMMGYERLARAPRLVDAADHPRVYDKSGNGTSAVLVDGRAAGVWEFEHVKDALTVRVAPFGEPSRRAEIEAEAVLLAEATGSTDLTLEFTGPPGLLADGARNAFMAPIRLGA